MQRSWVQSSTIAHIPSPPSSSLSFLSSFPFSLSSLLSHLFLYHASLIFSPHPLIPFLSPLSHLLHCSPSIPDHSLTFPLSLPTIPFHSIHPLSSGLVILSFHYPSFSPFAPSTKGFIILLSYSDFHVNVDFPPIISFLFCDMMHGRDAGA